MDTVLERIAAWQQAGLIDAATADRLRAAETDRSSQPATPALTRPSGVASAASSFFGPTPTIVEVFGYLGAVFLIAAWSTFLARIAGTADGTTDYGILALGTGLGAAVLLGIGIAMRNGDARRRRAGGAAILAATLAAASSGAFLGQFLQFDSLTYAVAAAAGALLVAVIGRIALPAVSTQAAVLFGVTGVGWTLLARLQPAPPDCCLGNVEPAGDVVQLVILPAIWWLLVAVGLGAIGLLESRSHGAPAQRRAGLTRFWAGLVAVAGVATSVFSSASLGNGEYGRLLEPWIGELAVLIVSLVLVERAFRRDSTAFIFAAAIGLVTALTDFNFRYLTDSTDVGLLVEGLILIGAGFAADRLRRRIDRSRATTPDEPPPVDPVTVEAPLPSA